MNILITGSGGFIGRNLKEYFQHDYDLLTPRSFELDLTDGEQVKGYFNKQDVDFVIHCGTKGGVRGVTDEASVESDNIGMVEHLLRYKSSSTPLIVFGSGAQYNKHRHLKKVAETELGSEIPIDLYGKSKMLIAQLVKDEETAVCLNIFGCYGKYEKKNRFPTYAILQHLHNEPIVINQNVLFDYLYVDDLSRIISHFIDKMPEARNINVTPSDSITLTEIAEIVNSFSGNKSEIIIKNKTLDYEYTGSNELLLKELPNFRFTRHVQGIKLLYDYLKREKK